MGGTPNHPKLDPFNIEAHGFGHAPLKKKTYVFI